MPNDASATSNPGGPSSESTPAAAASGTGPFRVLMEQYRVNEPYIQEVVDASRKILQTVLEGLAPGDCLKHAPVRTYFRILSGMIFILKVGCLHARVIPVLTFLVDLHSWSNRRRCTSVSRTPR